MKRILFLAACLIATAITAQAQKIPLYSEVFDEHTQKLESREWRSAEGHLRRESPDGSVTIYRADSAKIYTIDEKAKTVRELPFSTFSTLGQGTGLVRDASSTRELTGRETVEGYDCAVYRVTKSSTLASGATESTWHTEWYHEPLDLVIRYVESLNAVNHIKRNIRQGAQPAILFAIPRDYKRADTGAAMQQMGSQMDALKNATQMLKQGQQEQNRQLEENTKGKSEQEAIIEALKMMGGDKKK